MNIDTLKTELVRDEGVRYSPYKDSVGKLTVGVGHNLDDVPLSHDAVMQILQDDILAVMTDLDNNTPWWRGMGDVRQRVLANLCFQLGINGLMGFHKALAAMQAQDWDRAADELSDSTWAKQVGDRAVRLISMMRTGE